MHEIEKISKNCGLETEKPFILEQLFPLPFDRYVVIFMEDIPSRNYLYYQDVVDIMKPILNNQGIRIIQMSTSKVYELEETVKLVNGLDLGQVAYVVKNSLGVITTSEFVTQLAESYDKKILQLFSDSDSYYSGSYFGSEENYRKIKFNNKSDFDLGNQKSSINKILPTNIVDEFLSLMGIKNTFPFKEVRVGNRYINRAVEMVPTSTIDISSFKIDSIIVRMDLNHNEEILEQQLNHSVCCVITKKPISFHLLEKYRTRIKELAINVDSENIFDFTKRAFELGLRIFLFSDKEGDDLKKQKLKYLDYGEILKNEKSEFSHENKNNLFFKTKKLTFSSGKLYLSEQHFLDSDPSEIAKEIKPVKKSELFWKDLEHYTIYERKSN